MSCGVGLRQGLDPVLLWLWCRPRTTAPIQPLAWEPAYAAGAALRRKKKKANSGSNKKKKKKSRHLRSKDGSSRRGAVVNESD